MARLSRIRATSTAYGPRQPVVQSTMPVTRAPVHTVCRVWKSRWTKPGAVSGGGPATASNTRLHSSALSDQSGGRVSAALPRYGA